MDKVIDQQLKSHPLTGAMIVFWDFDGVIKESIYIKTKAFVKLFEPYGTEIAEKVRLHHEMNGGMSRFKKIPVYLGYAGIDSTSEIVDQLCADFANLVVKGVIEADWVPGAEDYIRSNRHKQIFILVSATPQEELESIIEALHMENDFKQIFGAPVTKEYAVKTVLQQLGIEKNEAIFVGDATADRDAAMANNIPFLLRRHDTNQVIFLGYTGPAIDNFENI
jgi:phosphoglycolate phosphatase-like HAD superfamily hydrolase